MKTRLGITEAGIRWLAANVRPGALTGTLRVLALMLVLSCAALASAPVSAKDHDTARDAVSSGQAQPLDAILPKVRARYPGRLLDAKLTRSGGKYRYVIKILDKKGKVRRVTVDARSGRILK